MLFLMTVGEISHHVFLRFGRKQLIPGIVQPSLVDNAIWVNNLLFRFWPSRQHAPRSLIDRRSQSLLDNTHGHLSKAPRSFVPAPFVWQLFLVGCMPPEVVSNVVKSDMPNANVSMKRIRQKDSPSQVRRHETPLGAHELQL